MGMNSIAQFPQFTPLSLSHKTIVTETYNSLKIPTSHRLFSNLFITDTDNSTHIARLNNNIIIDRGLYTNHEGVMICGENATSETLETVLRNDVKFVELSSIKTFDSKVDLDNSDYIYSTGKVALLEGSTYSNIRRKIRLPREVCTVGVVENDKVDEIWEMFEKWERENPLKKDILEREALEKALQFIDHLEIEYVGAYNNNLLVGFAGVEVTNHQHLMIHFIKAQTEIVGLSEFLFWQLAIMYRDRTTTINFEQDLGIVGLRQFKESLRPDIIQPVYTIASAKIV